MDIAERFVEDPSVDLKKAFAQQLEAGRPWRDGEVKDGVEPFFPVARKLLKDRDAEVRSLACSAILAHARKHKRDGCLPLLLDVLATDKSLKVKREAYDILWAFRDGVSPEGRHIMDESVHALWPRSFHHCRRLNARR